MIQLIPPCRFDCMAKLLYLTYRKYRLSFYLNLYKQHILVFNNGWEHPGTKQTVDEFVTHFERLLTSIQTYGYQTQYPIEIGSNGVLVNGAHRLMISYWLGIKPSIRLVSKTGCETYHYDFFRNRNNYWRRNNEVYSNLSKEYGDRMALEYCRIQSNCISVILYPKAMAQITEEVTKQLETIFTQYGTIYYQKQILLSKTGIKNLIQEMYRGESWIGGMFPMENCGHKLQQCYEPNVPIRYYLLHMKDESLTIRQTMKEQCRQLFGLGKQSLHIPDTHLDSCRISASLLNQQSIHFLEHGTNQLSSKNQSRLLQYCRKYTFLNSNSICLTSSIVLEMYGLRTAKDIDYIEESNRNIQLIDFGCHQGKWLNYYGIRKEEILYNPQNHFYWNGLKVVSLDVIRQMKQNRNEEKDRRDIDLINNL